MAGMKLSFIIEAIDKATAPVRKVNQVIDRMTEPARRVRASFNALVRESGLPRLGAQASEVSRRFGDVTSAARGVATALGIITGAGVAAFWGLKRIADEGDRALDIAERFGVSVEFVQRFGYAAKLNASSAEEAGEGLRFFARNAVEAANGSKEMAVWFTRAGVSGDALRKNLKDPEALLRLVSDGFSKMPEGPKKAAVAMGLFGRSGANLVQTLSLGSAGLDRFGDELESLGGMFDGEAAQSMGRFNDNWDRLLTAIRGVGVAVAKFLIPFLDTVITQFKDWIAANRALVASRITEFLQAIIQRLPAIWQGVTRFAAALVAVLGVLDTVARALGGWEVVLSAVAAVIVGKLLVALFMLGKAVFDFGLVLLTTPVGWFLLAVAAIAGIAALVVKNWEPIKAFFTDLWEGVKSAFSSAYEWIATKIAAITGIVTESVTKLNNMVPDWVKRYTLPGMALNAAAGALQTASAAPSALPAPGSRDADVGGTIRIAIDQEGRARVRELRSNNPGVDFDVDAGPLMVMP